jgi:hypothetical protein
MFPVNHTDFPSNDLTSNSHFPHPREQLNQATVGIRASDHYIGNRNTASIGVDQRQDERGRGESTESQGSGVAEFAEAGLVGCRLESTSERRHHQVLLPV